jgi:nucleoside-triphosphatase THEP1
MNNLAVRGNRNTGKSYLTEKVILEITGRVRMAGFFTKKFSSGEVTLRAWDNFSLFTSGPEVMVFNAKEHRIITKGFKELGVWAIERAIAEADLIVMDELGRFEIKCDHFIQTVHRAFDSDTPVLCSMKSEENVFLNSLIKRDDVILFSITERNREKVYNAIISKIKSMFLR